MKYAEAPCLVDENLQRRCHDGPDAPESTPRPQNPAATRTGAFIDQGRVRVTSDETPSNNTGEDTELSEYLAAMLEGTDSPDYAERMHRLAAEQDPWLVTAEHIAG